MTSREFDKATVEAVSGPDYTQFIIIRKGESVQRPYLYVEQTGESPVELSFYVDGEIAASYEGPTRGDMALLAVTLMATYPQPPFDAVAVHDDSFDVLVDDAADVVGMFQTLGFFAATHAPLGTH